MENPFLTIKEAAELLKTTPYSIRGAIKAGKLPAINLSEGGRAQYRLSREALLRAVEEKK